MQKFTKNDGFYPLTLRNKGSIRHSVMIPSVSKGVSRHVTRHHDGLTHHPMTDPDGYMTGTSLQSLRKMTG